MGQTDQSGNLNPADSSKDEAAKSFKITSEPVVHGALEENVHKYEATTEVVAHENPEDLGELPVSYGEDTLFLIARDPNWLFCYWDVNWRKFHSADMKDGQYRIYLKSIKAGSEEAVTQINPEARNWYLKVDSPGTSYRVELGYYDAAGNWATIVSSQEASTPSASVAEESDKVDFATIPFHLTFERLLEMVRNGMLQGENLVSVLSRLQGALSLAEGGPPNWTDDQKRLLALLLGDSATRIMAMGSSEIDQLLRQRLSERLNTESASELAALGRLSEQFAPGESSLFSALGGASLFSGLGGASLFSALGGASLFKALGAESLFSALGGASLFKALGGESLYSGALGGASLSSAFGGASLFSALGGASLFSGVGASWSAQPFGAEAQRGFFMHVNAEVIFYGGTHPDAKVSIDGKPIQLRPDGSFSYHFKLPDGKFEIPIVAEAPDGKEKRSATLTFERRTTREGDVGSTAQPPYLSDPMGRKS